VRRAPKMRFVTINIVFNPISGVLLRVVVSPTLHSKEGSEDLGLGHKVM